MTQLSPRFDSAARFREALDFVARVHAGQIRKSTDIPYIAHLLGVASIAIEYGADETEAVAALLHDAAEDHGGAEMLERIKELFGGEVAAIVDGCTDTYEDPKPSWPERKAKYIAHLRSATPSVRLVSGADKLHNARSILMDYRAHGDAVFDRFKEKSKFSILWYYRALAREFMDADPNPLAQELRRVVAEIEQLATARLAAGELTAKDRTDREMDAMIKRFAVDHP
ncbi:MAG TPA: HD domain-containing protein [Pyrinomonadaceae bacterium]|jgi:GTP pyrophosphokinase|nr:HD domain-containing protein [Pyrinomonadaceae bacterium]